MRVRKGPMWMAGRLLVGVAVAWGGGVMAGTPGSVAVVAVDGCAEGTSAPHAQALRDALARQSSVHVLSQAELLGRLGGAPRGTLADAERLLASARFDFFDQSAFDRAERTLLTAIDDLRVLPASDARWKDLQDAHSLLAFLYWRQDRKSAAEQTLGEVLAVDPKLQPSADLYPPSFRGFVDEVRKRLARRSTSILKVTTQPSGQPVIVEGREVGLSPVTLKLPPGRYRVEADFGTGGSVPRFVSLEASASLELRRDFEGQIFLGRGPCLGTGGTREGRLGSLVQLAALIGVDDLVGVREEEPARGERFVVATIMDSRSGQETREEKIKAPPAAAPDPGSFARLARFLSTGEAVPPVLVAQVTGGEDAPRRVEWVPARGDPAQAGPGVQTTGSGSSRRRIGAYAAGGVGIAALAGGTVFFLQSTSTLGEMDRYRDPANREAFLPDHQQEVSELQGRADAQRTTGMAVGAIGVAAMATSVALFLLDDTAAPASAAAVRPTGNGVLVRF